MALVKSSVPATNRWSSGGSLHAARFAGAAVLLSSGQVLIFGGLNLTADYPDSEVYDPATQTSVVLPGTIFSQPIALQLADGRAAVIETTMSTCRRRRREVRRSCQQTPDDRSERRDF